MHKKFIKTDLSNDTTSYIIIQTVNFAMNYYNQGKTFDSPCTSESKIQNHGNLSECIKFHAQTNCHENRESHQMG